MNTNLNKSALFGYVGCRGKEFFSPNKTLREEQLHDTANKLRCPIAAIKRVEQKAYYAYAEHDIRGLLAQALVHKKQYPDTSILICCDNLRLVYSYLHPDLVTELQRHDIRLMDTFELENMASAREDAELRAGIVS